MLPRNGQSLFLERHVAKKKKIKTIYVIVKMNIDFFFNFKGMGVLCKMLLRILNAAKSG